MNERVKITALPDGPYIVEGLRNLRAADGPIEVSERVALCRCGNSGKKPLCDGTHKTIGFKDPASPRGDADSPADSASGEGSITVADAGPLIVEGACDLAGGLPPDKPPERFALCRCGASKNKPFCDGSHTAVFGAG